MISIKKNPAARILALILLIFLGILWIFPLVWAFFTAFKSNNEIATSDFQLLPSNGLPKIFQFC
ncbi:hypothetical protein RQN30_06975 [Arcanobacterium hippocoleae]